MPHFNRRRFLRLTGSTIATLGAYSALFQQKADRYARVLAQSTPRKLALLVGINQYDSFPLQGCLHDVELQRHLLIHRFGFHPDDIYVLGNEAATREGILEAFEEHLIKQARPGDVVVYHYSGHGSRIFDPNPIVPGPDGTGMSGTFVPADGSLPLGYPDTGGTVKDITGHTLFLLMSALNTENVTVVLDSCFAGGATRDTRVRSRDGGRNVLVSPDEYDYQQKWLSRLDMSPEEFIGGYRAGVAKGIVLAAAAPNQLANELRLNGFTSGLFSYLLTHYLWQDDSTIEQVFQQILPEIPERWRQTPRYEVAIAQEYHRQSPYFIEAPGAAAQAVVIQVQEDRAEVWLGGVDLREVEAGTRFMAMEGSGEVRVVSRDGMVAQAQIEGLVTEGTPLRLVA